MKLRISNHKLNIETGWCNKIRGVIEFVLFVASKYSSIRDDFLNKRDNKIPDYKHIPILTLIIQLMNSTDYYLNKQLVQYVSSCLEFEMRDNLL